MYGPYTAQAHAREPKKLMRMTQNSHVIFLKLVLFGVDAGVIIVGLFAVGCCVSHLSWGHVFEHWCSHYETGSIHVPPLPFGFKFTPDLF